MYVRPIGAPTISHQTDGLTALHTLTLMHDIPFIVCVEGHEPPPMVKHDHIAIARRPAPAEQDYPCSRCNDWGTSFC
jgi:hypothetical protein